MKSQAKKSAPAPKRTKHTLQVSTPSDREIAMTRVFDAPRKLVFDAYTKPELLKRWLGVYRGWTLDEVEVDLRPGGKYRYLWRGPKREDMGMGGVFKEVVPNERIVATEQFDNPWYPGEAVSTVIFTEKNGQTTLSMTIRYDSKEIRDGVLKSGMEGGMAAGFDLLEEMVTSAATRGTK